MMGSVAPGFEAATLRAGRDELSRARTTAHGTRNPPRRHFHYCRRTVRSSPPMGCSALANGKFGKVGVTLCQWLPDQAFCAAAGRRGRHILIEGSVFRAFNGTLTIDQPRNRLNAVLWNAEPPLESPPSPGMGRNCIKLTAANKLAAEKK